MTLFQDTGGDPRTARAFVADVLAWFGAVGDAAMGNAPGFAVRKASLAVALAQTAQLPQSEWHALYFAGLLHAIGAIGNPAYRKGDELSERIARMESWDAPAQGAQICEAIGSLPAETGDMVRWQHEAWDGTGYPDLLRWTGIPRPAQFLGMADRFVRADDPEETLGQIGLESGRAFNPETVRTFSMWFHLSGGEIELVEAPVDALLDAPPDAQTLLERFADRIDAHNGEKTVEDEHFDPLARLGVDQRARNASTAAAIALAQPALRSASAIVLARGEWFDGSGKPHGHARSAVPITAGILAAAIAYERLDRGERIDTAAGTQFAPAVVRALMEAAKLRA